jgi:sulfopyruvate decarboxylase subunit beta
MNKDSAMRVVVGATSGHPVVFTTGYACRIASGIADRGNHFYMTGSMGLASSVAVGVAEQSGLCTVVVDGDGSLLMNPVGLITAGARQALPLVHLMLDDGRYASTGGQEVPVRPDFGALARACGYLGVHDVETAGDLEVLLRGVLSCCSSPTFIRCALSGAEPPVPPRVDTDLGDHAHRFGGAVRALAGARA